MNDTVASDTASSGPVETSALVSEVFQELSAESQPASEPATTEQPSPAAAPTAPQAAHDPAAPAASEPAGTETAGGIPPERHKAILETERGKRTEVETRLKTIETEVLQPMSTDPVGWLVSSFAEVLNDPQYANDPRLKSFAGRNLRAGGASSSAAPTAEDVVKPTITPLVDQAGNKVYAAEDVEALLAWQEQKLLGQVKQELAPLEAIQTERAQERQVAQARAVVEKVAQQATSIMSEYRKAPGWTKALEPQVKARMNELRAQGISAESALAFAYQQIVVPTLGQQERQAVVSALHNKTQTSPISTRSTTAPAKPGPVDTRSVAAQVLAELSA